MASLINTIKKQIRNVTGYKSGRSFRISYFRQRGNRQFLAFALLSLPVIIAFRSPSLLEREFFDITARAFAYFCLFVIMSGIAWSGIWLRTRYVTIQQEGIELTLPLVKLNLPWKMIGDFEAIKLDQAFPTESLSLRQQQKLGQLHYTHGILVHLNKNALGYKRWLVPWPILGKSPQQIFLPTDEWEAMLQKLPKIVGGRPEKKRKRSVQDFSALTQENSSSAEILCITAGSRVVGQLVNQLDGAYSISVKQDGVEAIRQFRSFPPKIVLVDTHLPKNLTPLQLINSLSKYTQHGGTTFVILTSHPLEPDDELELFEAGIKECIDIKRNLPVALNRIDFWINWQEQASNMAKRNQELYGQNLHQRSELARHGALMHFLPKDVAEEVIAGTFLKEAAQLRKQTVTVLFADIVGFTPISAQLEVDMLADLLNDYLQRMTEVVVNHGGIVDKFIGDEVMALFGAPDKEPETVQVQNAFSAALAMVDVIKVMDQVWRDRLPAELNIRAGINTGVCTAGLFGSESLRSYTVIGSPVNLAARLTSTAPPGGIATCANSLKWVQMRTKFSKLGNIPLKGIVKPVDVYQLLGVAEPDLMK